MKIIKKATLLVLTIFVFSCQKKIAVQDLKNLNGYWQIAKVETTSGQKKEYTTNENYDFFELKDLQGFHKKVQWQPFGKYLTDNLYEKVQLAQQANDWYINCSSPYGKHTEKIITIDNTQLVIQNQQKTIFYYTKINASALNKTYGKKVE